MTEAQILTPEHEAEMRRYAQGTGNALSNRQVRLLLDALSTERAVTAALRENLIDTIRNTTRTTHTGAVEWVDDLIALARAQAEK